jgi:diguanylate cyclase (GGDEF)-like protein
MLRGAGIMRLIRRKGKTERTRRATGSLYKSYFRTLYFSRLAWVAFWACFVYFIVWSIPVFGIGLSADDYTPQLAVTMTFACFCVILASLSGMLRKTARRKREALVAWSSLYDETTGAHTRSHLYDRLSLECERAERHGGSFALLMLKLRASRDGRHGGHANSDFLRTAARRVQELIRGADLVALVSNDEFGVLLCGVSADAAAVLAGRLRDSLERTPPDAAENGGSPVDIFVKVGTAIYGDDGHTPEALLEAARSKMTRLDDSLPVAGDEVA